jgi:ATP-dependent helicase/DNAse subunit B
MRGRRLQHAAARIEAEGLHGIRTVWMDGFHALPEPELRVIGAMGQHAELTLAMDDADLTETVVARLGELEFSEEALRGGRTRAAIAVVKAPGIEREVDEIARRIVEQADAGRPFREMGVVVHTEDVYAPLLRSTLERFGIPARFYFDAQLERHPVVRYLAGAVDAMLGGWDHAETLAVLRLAPRLADFDAADRWDFAVREQMPNAGVESLRALLRHRAQELVRSREEDSAEGAHAGLVRISMVDVGWRVGESPEPVAAPNILPNNSSVVAPREANGVADSAKVAAPNEAAAAQNRLEREIDALAALEAWRGLALAPKTWAARVATFGKRFRLARPAEPATHEETLEWRSQAAVLQAFEAALHEAAQALRNASPISLADYWRVVKSVLRLTPLRLEDGRRNVVHVMSAHEAREWVLPVVFACGMVEKQFPKAHPQDPFFSDVARCQLNAAGVRVRTVAEFEREQRALFDAAVSAATMVATLSYPEFDARGERTLPSMYLEGVLTPAVDAVAARPRARGTVGLRGGAQLAGAAALDYLRERTAKLSPSGLETYLQCPFQYFTQRLLRLKSAPGRAEKRLNALVQGEIVHEVLKEWWTAPQDVAPIFERVFADRLARDHIPSGYETERVRNGLLDDLLRFTSDDSWLRADFRSETEINFAFPLAEGVEVAGRIDRLDVAEDGSAYVIDYKYSRAQRVKDKLKDETLLQAPLYLMAAEHLGKRPAGMYYVGVKGKTIYAGWTSDGQEPSLPMPERWLETTRERTLGILREIREGRVAVAPADREACAYCESRDVCRIDVTVGQAEAEGA